MSHDTFDARVKIYNSESLQEMQVDDFHKLIIAMAEQTKYSGKLIISPYLHEHGRPADAVRTLDCRLVTSENSQVSKYTFAVAQVWRAYQPLRFSNQFGFRRALMGNSQRDVNWCNELHKYDSLEFIKCNNGAPGTQPTYKPFLTSKHVLEFFTNPIKIRTNETAVNIKDIAIRSDTLARHIKEVQSKNPGIVNRYMQSQ